MPGLLRGVARTAVIAGTATSVSNRVSRRQGRRWAEHEAAQQAQFAAQQAPAPQYQAPAPQYQAPPAPAASGASSADRIEQLKQLAELRSQGVLTDAEFEAEKARILSS